MAEADTARLCEQIIHSHFGPVAANVASALLTRGRLPLAQLIRVNPTSKPRDIRTAVLALIQHNVLWHAQTEEDGEVLEVNVEECLVRLRFGRFVWQAFQLFGQAGGEIIQLVLDHGNRRPPDIISALTIDSKTISQTLYTLVSLSYLKPSTILSHISPRDKRIQYEAEEKAKISGFPTAKELRQAKEVALARLKREEEEAEKVGLTKKRELPGPKSAKRKLIDEEVVDDDVYFRVNFDKFNVHIRNAILEAAARERFNNGAALVLRATLKATEPRQMNAAELRSDTTSLAAISKHISDDDADELSAGLILTSKKKPSSVTCIKEYLGMMSAADNPTPAGRAAAFTSMASGSSKVHVEFAIIGRRLRRRILEAVTRERHGDPGVRVLRLLLDTGKMDEKQIAKVAMMSAKDVRPLLSAMSTDSLISTQEVPKTADRNPTRTFYLWYVDLQKAYSALLNNLYKTLYNISLRRQAEEAAVKRVLAKSERTDARQRDEDLLDRSERAIAQDWESKRERLTILEMRVEEAAFILGDLGTLGNEDD